MIKLLIVWNAAVTIVLTAVLLILFSHRSKVEHVSPTDVVRTSRLEIVYQTVRSKRSWEQRMDGRQVQSSFSLQSRRSRGRHPDCEFKWLRNDVFPGQADGWKGFCWLSVGQRYPLSSAETEDPLASWGIRVRGQNLRQTSFGLLNNGESIPQSK